MGQKEKERTTSHLGVDMPSPGNPGSQIRNATHTNTFKRELTELLNKYGVHNHSDTSDSILAEHLMGCLDTFADTQQACGRLRNAAVKRGAPILMEEGQ